MFHWFIRFLEFTEFKESSAPFRKNSIVYFEDIILVYIIFANEKTTNFHHQKQVTSDAPCEFVPRTKCPGDSALFNSHYYLYHWE